MINFSDIAYIQNGTSLCLMNCKNKNYLTLDTTNNSFKANSYHPYLTSKEFAKDISISTEFILVLSSSPNYRLANVPRGIITYGTQVSLMVTSGLFVVATNNGEVRLEPLKGDSSLASYNLPANSKFTVIDPYNQSNFSKPLLFNDEIVLRSTFGGYLILGNSIEGVEEQGLNAINQWTVTSNGMIIVEDTIWKLIKTAVPYIPDWVYKRKYLNFNLNSYLFNLDKSLESGKSTKVNKIKEELPLGKEKTSLMMLSTAEQDRCLVEDILLVMVGLEGNYIKRITTHTSFKDFKIEYQIEPYLDNPTCDPPLLSLVSLLLPLSFYFGSIGNYLNMNSHMETGLIAKSFCMGLRKVIRDYVLFVNQLEGELRFPSSDNVSSASGSSSSLNLQQLWWLCQPSIKLLESIHKLCQKCSMVKGGALINIIYSAYLHETDTEMKKLYKYLLDKSFIPYFHMLKQWTCRGMLDSEYDYQEFMILSTKDYTRDILNDYYDDLFWDKKFILNPVHIPEFLDRVAEKIIFIGKSLNIIRECGKIIQCPYENEFENFGYSETTIESEIDRQNDIINDNPNSSQSIFENERFISFENLMNKIYQWTNATLKTILFKEKNLDSLFKSIKKFYLMECGDFYTHLIDLADEMLLIEKNKINFDKLKNHIENAFRSTSANLDINKDIFSFSLSNMIITTEKVYLDKYSEILRMENNDILSIIGKINELNSLQTFAEFEDCKILESLVLECNISWPLNLIFSKKSLIKYKILFRQLLLLKYEERELSETWILQQNFKEFRLQNYLKPSYLLRDKMMNFIKSMIYYFFNEVIEPNYLIFINNLINSTSIEDVILSHDQLLDKCLKECLLEDTDILKDINDIIHCCFFYSRLIIKYYNSAIMDEKLVHHQGLGNLDRKGKLKTFERRKIKIEEQNKVLEEIFIAGKHKFLQTVEKFKVTFEGRLEMFLDKISKM